MEEGQRLFREPIISIISDGIRRNSENTDIHLWWASKERNKDAIFMKICYATLLLLSMDWEAAVGWVPVRFEASIELYRLDINISYTVDRVVGLAILFPKQGSAEFLRSEMVLIQIVGMV